MVRVHHLTKRYRTVTAVDDDLSVEAGDPTAPAGPPRCRSWPGLAAPDSGTATINLITLGEK